MKTSELEPQIQNVAQDRLNRRKFFRQAGLFGFGAIASSVALSGTSAKAQQNGGQALDTVDQMFTAFLIAEDLATTFYYNGLTGAVVQDPSLAGPGGTIRDPKGDPGNVDYLGAAYAQEVEHAHYFRAKLTGSAKHEERDPYQTFYFPAGTFDSIGGFLPILNALENAFIGAYIILIQELSYKAVQAAAGTLIGRDARFTSKQYQLLASVAGSILGVEAEHRVLGRVIGGSNPANNLYYEQTDGLTSIYNGSKSAVVALTPFLSPGTGPGYSLATALAGYSSVYKSSTGQPPVSA